MKFVIPYALHISYPGSVIEADGGTTYVGHDGVTRQADGALRPSFDTLIAVANRSTSAATVRFTLYKMDGSIAKWKKPDSTLVDYWDYPLAGRKSIATTLMPFNLFHPASKYANCQVDSPKDFIGYAEVEAFGTPFSQPDIYCAAMLGGGGPYPDHWNQFSASVPVISSPAKPSILEPRDTAALPYAIHYHDTFHDQFNYNRTVPGKSWLDGPITEDNTYTSGVAIQNRSSAAATFQIEYFPNTEIYTGLASSYTTGVSVPANGSHVFELFRILPGYSANASSEGWVEIRRTGGPGVFTVYLLVANQSYNRFSAGILA